jgi:WD40 repeat protein
VSGSTGRAADVWDAGEQKLLRSLGGHDGWVFGVTFAPDGKRVATASMDKRVRIFDVGSGTLVQRLEGHTDWASGLAFSGDGRTLATSGKDGVVILWDTGTWKQKMRLTGHKQWANRVAFSPDDRLLASAGDDSLVMVWEVATGELKLRLRNPWGVSSVSFARDGRSLAVATNQMIYLYPLDISSKVLNARDLLEKTQRDLGMQLRGFDLQIPEAGAR